MKNCMESNTVYDCSLIKFPKNISVNSFSTKNFDLIPFDISRVYYLYNLNKKIERGSHAHKNLKQVIIAPVGSFEIILNDSVNKLKFTLDKPNIGLLVKPGIWRELNFLSTSTVCLVLASDKYLEEDYIRDFKKFSNSKLFLK